jgi:hypothetical protein
MRRKWIIVAVIAAAALVCAIAPLLDRSGSARAAMREPSPEELRMVSTPALEAALHDPEALLAFITRPDTPYRERLAATLRGAPIVPPEYAPRVVTMIGELRDELVVHWWGMKQHPHDSTFRMLVDPIPVDITRDGMVLGRKWQLPDRRVEYPTTFDEECGAPWPWQVQQCLPKLLIWMTPRASTSSPLKTATSDTDRWLNACMAMPVESDRDARLFVEATLGGSWFHVKSVPVMSRWLQIALDPAKPQSATMVGQEVAGASVNWGDPRAKEIGEILIAEIIARSPHREARHRAAYGLSLLRYNGHYSPPRKEGMEPTLAVHAACERATDRQDTEWNRLYVFAVAACKNLDDPPIQLDHFALKPDSPESKGFLARFDQWYGEHRQELSDRASKRRAELKTLIDELNAS